MSSMAVITGRGRSIIGPPLRALYRQPIYVILAVVLLALLTQSPAFETWPGFMAFLKRATPLMILAAGEAFVIVSGEFDLSVGSQVTVAVVVANRLIHGVESRTWWVIGLLLALGVLWGVINGAVTTLLRVPSFITTLGTLLILEGGVLYWTGGSPSGSVPTNFRVFGRGNILNFPVIEVLPWAVVTLVVVGVAATLLLHRTIFGKQLFAAGGNPRTAALSGVPVARVRILAFVISGLCASIAGTLIGGLFPLSQNAGEPYGFQALSAVVLGGAVLGGGRGSIPGAMAGALVLLSLFALLNIEGLSAQLQPAVQGIIVIGAMAYAGFRLRRSA